MPSSINIPHFKAFIRAEYLHNLESHYGELVPCRVFGATSISGRAIGFNLMLDNGAQFARMPVSSLTWDEKWDKKDGFQDYPLDFLQLWDCLSYEMEAIAYSYLAGLECKVRLKNNQWVTGEYLFTFDWTGGDYPEDPAEHKCGHLIRLDNGQFAIQPNNRIIWADPSFIVNPLSENPGYKINTHVWKCENAQWISGKDDRFFYEIGLTPK